MFLVPVDTSATFGGIPIYVLQSEVFLSMYLQLRFFTPNATVEAARSTLRDPVALPAVPAHPNR